MSAAPGYTPTTSFANDETNGVAGRSTVKTVSLDTEHANIASSINALNTNLKIIQRDDGKLKDFAVEPYALSEQARSLIATGGTPRGMWAAATLYEVSDVVQYGTIAYMCYVQHISTGVFDATKFIAISGDGQAAYHAAQAAASEASAATSAATATTQATNAAASASSAATQASNAATSASNASTNAGIALGHANNASTSATNAALSYDSFDDRYLGAKAADPTVDNDGNPLLVGALYWNTTTNTFKAWDGSAWNIFTVNAQPLDNQLTTLAGITAQQATDLASLSALIGTLLNDTTQPTALATLGAPLNAVSAKSANYTVVAADMGKFFTISGSTTISLTAAATLGANFSFSIRNSGVNSVTIDPNGVETIDGVASVSLIPGETCFVICDGASWITVARASNPFAVNQSLAASGYQKLPGGLVLQWGVTSSVANGAGRTATFPIAFPTAAFAGFVMGTVGGGTAEANHVVTALSTTTLTFTNNSTTTQPFYYFALGY